VSASGIDQEPVGKARFFHNMAKNALRRWRAADIAHANEKYSDL
jgi:hypothetical protein